ncbi:MAG: dynamin family protein, partial [Lachnospiraceae bacterium]|nr:dynamin family protein [Lachnospiraceae bacterium]
MKFKDNVKMDNQQKELVQNIPQKEDKINYENTEMQSQSDELVDKLQADIVNSGSRLLAGFRGENRGLWNYVKPKTDTGTDPVRAAEVSIKELQDFQYTIGFAGGQSAGKSTVVNALLKYPLMPTCQIVTTCTPVELFYGERIRILVSDAYTGKILLDYPCDRATDSDFQKLKEYTCTLSALPQVIENLQPFVKGYIGGYDTGIKPDQLEMQKDNPRHVAILMMILLTVYVTQNLEELTHKQRALNQLRDRTLKYFKIPANVPNIAVHIQWNSSILKSGLKILDLPGLGSNAEDKELDDGSILDGHTKITKKAIVDTKTMVVVQDPFVLGSVWEAVKEMVSNLLAREVVVENCIIPVLNKFDMCNGSAGQQSALSTYISDLKNLGVKKEVKDVFPLSAIYGEYAYEDCPDKSRTMYVQKALQGVTDQDYINDIMYMKPRELKREYEKSGVEELREFFRTTFIERGKLESSLSVVAEIKSLESGIRAEIIAQKKMYEGFVGA